MNSEVIEIIVPVIGVSLVIMYVYSIIEIVNFILKTITKKKSN